MSTPYKGRPPRLPEVFDFQEPAVYFVTFCTFARRPVLASDSIHHAFRQYAERGMTEKNVAVGRYVIMPDHVHLFVSGNVEFNLGLWIRGLKRALAAGLTDPDAGRLWQPGFFDHRLRSNESYAAKWNYVQQNPVRAGLVTRAEDWRYQGEVVAIDWV